MNHSIRMVVAGIVLFWGPQTGQSNIIRIGTYNTFNNPDNAVEDAWFGTIFDGISNKAINGTAARLDLLAVAETDTDSVARLPRILNDIHGVSSYEAIVSSPDGGHDRTGIIYDTNSLTLLDSVELTAGFVHHILRGEFSPIGTGGGSDFFVYSIHLKSGSSNSAKTMRAEEAMRVRSDADALRNNAHVIFAGDFNMRSSDEGGWLNLVDSGNAQAFDVAGAPGSWHENPEFLRLHTQDSRVAMDDRFDLQLVTAELLDGKGLDYIADSFCVFGNNGTHHMNGPITGGNAASEEIVAALVAASDHLPTIADYRIPDPNIVAIMFLAIIAKFGGKLRGRPRP